MKNEFDAGGEICFCVSKMKQETTFSARIRFNWGFHDATSDREQKRRNRMFIPEGELFCLPPHDKVYSDAYAIGQNWDISNGRPETSDDAWREYQKEKNEKTEKQKQEI